jgi:hypothetical protein
MGTPANPPAPPARPSVIPGNIYPNGQPSAGGIYVGFNDYLQLTFTAAAQVLNIATITARIIRTDGSIVQFSETIPNPNAYTQNSFRVALCEGWLISACVVSGTAFPPPRGTFYGTLMLARSAGSSFVPSTILVSDYLTLDMPLAWPGGLIRSSEEGPGWTTTYGIGGTVGVDWSWNTPTALRVRVLAVGATLNCSATVANRQVRLTLNGVPLDVWFVAPGFNATASSSYIFSWLPGCSGLISTPPAYTLPLPDYLLMGKLNSLATATLGLQSGDTWGNIYVTTEAWLSNSSQ